MPELTRRRAEDAVVAAAELFAPAARETILYENRFKHVHELLSIAAGTPADGALLDLGGGLGVNLIVLRRLGHTGRLILVDRFEEYDAGNRMGSLDETTGLLREHDVTLVPQDFVRDAQLPVERASCVTATCFDVVEHLPRHPLRQLRELRRVLAKGGNCLISGPNGASLMKRLRLAAGKYPYSAFDAWVRDPYFEHIREYTRVEYEMLLRLAGFTGVRSEASAAVTFSRARFGYHRRPLATLSPKRAALWGLALAEGAFPGLRHAVYAAGVAP